MPTKLSRYCDGVMEAAWLAAVIVIPVFFNVYSSRIFEPDKLSLLRTLALVILGAWIVKLVETGRQRTNAPEGGRVDRFKRFMRYPLMLPVSGLAVLYLISTAFSVTPSNSFWGSYQRLQGTYTTFSYLVIFAAILSNLRQRVQMERLFSAIIIASLPVSLYGVLQRYQIDPVPWGGNTVVRIAANLGNPIFVAAYLILAFPLTLFRIVHSFIDILTEREGLAANFARATAYIFIAALQIIALVLSGSRGPLLGWLASTFFMFLVLSLLWRQRWFTFGVVGVTLVLGLFLVLLNFSGGPFERIRNTPGIGRLGQLLDPESTTGRVRVYIWKGVAQLVAPHSPLEFPDGHKDPFNILRPLVGYGPESMYVAYNRFYQPELTTVEKRNASPDRSHNETWDSLVITGLLGLITYLALFGSIFYYGLKWLGLVTNSRQRILFLGLYLGGGGVSAAGFVLWKGVAFFGVGLPFGMIIGVFLYLILISLFGRLELPKTPVEKANALVLLALLAGIVAHFIEINFGIAIAVTRLYFWIYTSLLLLVGYVFPRLNNEVQVGQLNEFLPEKIDRSSSANARKKRKTARGPYQTVRPARPVWFQEALVSGGILSVLLVTLGYDFVNIGRAGSSVVSTMWDSLVRLGGANPGTSYGVLAMVLSAWLFGGVIFASEGDFSREKTSWLRLLSVILGVSLLITLLYWFWHAAALTQIYRSTPATIEEVLVKVSQYEGLLTIYFAFLLLLVLGLAFLLTYKEMAKAQSVTLYGSVLASVLLVLVLGLSAYTNLRIIQADIAFKLADPFTRSDSWPVAISVYNRATRLAPTEDFYYLFLGRAYLESAKTTSNEGERDTLIQESENNLKKAQDINPLNTDHTANLARLYSLWASMTKDGNLRQERAKLSDYYFRRATTLSPNNSRIWDEWALLYINTLNQPQEAFQRLNHSLEIDPLYDFTQALLAEYYLQQAKTLTDPQAQTDAYNKAIGSYLEAIKRSTDLPSRVSYLTSLAQIYIDNGQLPEAINTIQQAIEVLPQNSDRWRYEQTLAQLFLKTGDKTAALEHANQALAMAPENQRTTVQNLISQLQSGP